MVRIPYSKQYEKNLDRLKMNETPCAICGKAAGVPNPYVRTWEGAYIVTEDEAKTLNPNGDTGNWPIGPDCLKRHPELKAYL